MGLRSIIDRLVHREVEPAGAQPRDNAPAPVAAAPAPDEGWEPLPAYLPVDAREHAHVVAIASAIAAGDHPDSTFTATRVYVANPEHARVSAIAAALATGGREDSRLVVKRICKQKESALEGTHAA